MEEAFKGVVQDHQSHSLVLELRVSQRAQLLAPVSAQVCHVGDQGMLLWSV